MVAKRLDIRSLNRYCVICQKEFNTNLVEHCTSNSVVAIKKKRLFRKKTFFFDLQGNPLTKNDIDRIREREKRILDTRKLIQKVQDWAEEETIWSSGWPEVVEQLTQVNVQNDGPLAKALANVLSRKDSSPDEDNELFAMIDLMVKNADRQDLGDYLVRSYLGRAVWSGTKKRREKFIEYFIQYADAVRTPLVKTLVEELGERDSLHSIEILEALERIDVDRTEILLIEWLPRFAGNIWLFNELYTVLERLNPKRAMTVRIESFVKRAKETAGRCKREAIKELQKIDDPKAKAALQAFRELDFLKTIQTDIAALYKDYSDIPTDYVRSLIEQFLHSGYDNEKKELKAQLNREENVPALIKLLLGKWKKYEDLRYTMVANTLGTIRPVIFDTIKALGLVALNEGEASYAASNTLVQLDTEAKPGFNYLLQMLEHDCYAEEASLCLAQIGLPEHLIPLGVEKLISHLITGPKTEKKLTLEHLLRIGEPALNILIPLVNEGKFEKEITEKILNRYGIKDRVAILISVLKNSTINKEKLQAATELELCNDPRARDALVEAADILMKARQEEEEKAFRQQFEFGDVNPAELYKEREKIVRALEQLPVKSEIAFVNMWSPKPTKKISGKEKTTDWLIAKIQEEAYLIRSQVWGIRDLYLKSELVPIYGKPKEYSIQLWRVFENNADFIPHVVVRISENKFVIGMLPIKG